MTLNEVSHIPRIERRRNFGGGIASQDKRVIALSANVAINEVLQSVHHI